MHRDVSSKVHIYRGGGFQSFQVDRYRIWLLDSEWLDDSCHSMRLVAALCEKGLLTGKSFYAGLDSSDDSLSAQSTAPSNSPNLGEDFRSFSGKPTYIERAWVNSIRHGPSVDTVFVGLSVDLTGKLPGPMSVFQLSFTCSKNSNPCHGFVDDPQVIAVQLQGMIL